MGIYAGVDYNLTLSQLQRRLQHIYYGGQPYARVDHIPQSGTLDLASGTDSSLSIALLTFLTLLSAALVEMEDNGSYFTPNALCERSGFLCKEVHSLPTGGKISKCRFSFQPLDVLIK